MGLPYHTSSFQSSGMVEKGVERLYEPEMQQNISLTQQDSCMYELRVIMTSCKRPRWVQSRETPNMGGGGGIKHYLRPSSIGNC